MNEGDIDRLLYNYRMKRDVSEYTNTDRLRFLCEKYTPKKMKRIREFVEKGADVNAEYGIYPTKTILRSVCDTYTPAKMELVRFLIESDADVDAKDNGYPKISVLQSVCQSYTPEKLKLVKLLIDHGADVNKRDDRLWGKNIVQQVCEESYAPDRLELVKLLVASGADITSRYGSSRRCTIQEVCRTYTSEKRELLGYLLGHVYASNIVQILDYAQSYNFNDNFSYLELVSIAIDEEFDPNSQDDSGHTLLSHVSSSYNIELIRFLCPLMTDINEVDDYGHTAWPTWSGKYDDSVEEQEKYVQMSRVFLSHGADPRAGRYNKIICLLSLPSVDVTDILREIYDIVDVDDDEDTILHLAADCGDVPVILEMLKLGTMVNTQNKWGYTPLHRAADNEHLEAVVELIKVGADVNIQNENGDTPLHLAVINNSISCAMELIKAGADASIQNYSDETPLHCAASREQVDLECIKSLMSEDVFFITNDEDYMFIELLSSHIIGQLLLKAIEIDSSLRVFQECIARLEYRDRKYVRQTLLVLNRLPIPTTLFPLIIANTFEDHYRDSDVSSDGSYDSD